MPIGVKLSREEYEKTRPAGEQKLELPGYVIRAYVDDSGSAHVLVHRITPEGHEELPLGYLLGSNALSTLPPKRS